MNQHRLPNGLTVFHLNRGETIYLYKDVFEHRCYFQYGLGVKPGDVVFDVGANIGMASLFFHLAAPGVRLFSFEPAPVVCEILKANMALHGVDAKVFNCAVSDAPGKATFTFYSGNSVYSTLHEDVAEDEEAARAYLVNLGASKADAEYFLKGKYEPTVVETELRTVSDVMAESGVDRIDFLKIDAQRAELAVMGGVRDADWPKIRQVAIEVHDIGGRLATVRQLLEQRGFEVFLEQEDFLKGSVLYNLFARRPA